LHAEEAGSALEGSQLFNVSPELQKANKYFELSFSSCQIGAQKISQACDRNDTNMLQAGLADISRGAEYSVLGNRELDNLVASLTR
jgi:hypothetical protein